MISGSLGSDQQISTMIAEGKIDVMIFFWGAMQVNSYDSNVKALLKLGVAWNILLACDRATTDFMFTFPLMQQEYVTVILDYSSYLHKNGTR